MRDTRGMVDGGGGGPRKANDTSLGNFNFAEITVGLIRIKRSLVAGQPSRDIQRQPPATLETLLW